MYKNPVNITLNGRLYQLKDCKLVQFQNIPTIAIHTVEGDQYYLIVECYGLSIPFVSYLNELAFNIIDKLQPINENTFNLTKFLYAFHDTKAQFGDARVYKEYLLNQYIMLLQTCITNTPHVNLQTPRVISYAHVNGIQWRGGSDLQKEIFLSTATYPKVPTTPNFQNNNFEATRYKINLIAKTLKASEIATQLLDFLSTTSTNRGTAITLDLDSYLNSYLQGFVQVNCSVEEAQTL